MKANLAAGGKIYNVNVRGKRGNIVQVYPSVEYDFVPNMLALSTSDMIHFQWTGSDYNPRVPLLSCLIYDRNYYNANSLVRYFAS